MRAKTHAYSVAIRWTGNDGAGTAGYQSYRRTHEIQVFGKPLIYGSADPAFRGDHDRYNPEELLVVALSACHMLWYLHLCADAGVIVHRYEDQCAGQMEELANGSGHFVRVILRPLVGIARHCSLTLAEQLHQHANERCFLANSVNFPVEHEAVIEWID